MRVLLKAPFWWLLIVVLALAACDEPVEENLLPTVAGEEPQAVAVNPPRVWIDSPLQDTALIFDGSALPVIAHASFLSGSALLRVADGNGATLETIALAETDKVTAGSGLLTRHEGEWLPKPQDAANVAPDGSVIYRLTVELGGLESEPVILRMYQATPTPSPSPTLTATPTGTPTFTLTSTSTGTATDEFTATPTATATGTEAPSVTPSETASPSPTDAPTFTPTVTQDVTDMPVIVFGGKNELPCLFYPIRGLEVAARVGPGDNRGSRFFLEQGEIYTAIAYNNDTGVNWWQANINNENVWVDSNQVIETGSCAVLVYEPAPPLVFAPPPQVPQETEPPPDAPPGQPVIYFFTATPLNSDYCTVLSWSVEFVDAVYLDGQGVVGVGSQPVCIGSPGPRTFTLTIFKGGAPVDSRSVTVSTTSAPPPVVVTTVAPPPRPNNPPVITDFTVTNCYAGTSTGMTVFFNDPDGDPVRFSSASTSDTDMIYIPARAPTVNTGSIFVPFACRHNAGSGTVRITVTITDGRATASRSVSITAPVFTVR